MHSLPLQLPCPVQITHPATVEQPSPEEQLPFVSVVIPVRNDAVRLARCLRSLGNQDYPQACLEIIVVDNGSQDDSLRIAEKFGAKTLRYPDLRVGALRNRGVAESLGEILAFVDSDHEVPPDWIRTATDDFLNDPALSMLGAHYLAPPQGTWVQRAWELQRLQGRDRRPVPWLGAGNMFIRRNEFQRLGGFREDLVAAEDVDLCVRLVQNSGKIISDMRVANIHHGEPKSVWRFFWKECWRGSSSLRAFFSHGMPLQELPSLMFPAYHFAFIGALVVALLLALLRNDYLPLAVVAILLTLPSIVLASLTAWRSSRLWAVFPLAILYFTYGMARAVALFR